MNVVIVGHGPSAINAMAGEEIDKYDVVIRQKRCEETLKHPDIYGTRTDVVSGSWTIGTLLPNHVKSEEYWIFLDSRHKNVKEKQIQGMKALYGEMNKRLFIDKDLCDAWNETYRDMRTPDYEFADRQERKETSDDLGHTHMSAGMHTIIYACKRLMPKTITLVGFDNIFYGDFEWSVTRGPNWHKYPDHRWDIEHQLIPMVSECYNVPIGFIMPGVKNASIHNVNV